MAATVLVPVRYQSRQIRACIQEPFQSLAEFRHVLQQLRLERLDRKQRDQSNHRAQAQGREGAVWQPQHVVEELVLVVPQADAVLASDPAHRLGDVEEMLEELRGNVFVDMIVLCQLERDAHEIERVHRHPARTVRLIEVPSVWQPGAAVKDADVVEAEETALKDVATLGVLAIHPPCEIEHELVEGALQEREVAVSAMLLAVDLKYAPRRPRVHRRTHIAQRPFVCRELPIRMHVPLASEQQKLLLGELAVDVREREAMKTKIPGRVPGVFPFVRHRDHIGVVEMGPLPVATLPALGWRSGLSGITGEPLRHVVVEELLAPDHPREGLALHGTRVGLFDPLLHDAVELVRLTLALREERIEFVEAGGRAWGKSQANLPRGS